MGMMSAALRQQIYEDSIRARWHGGPSVLALLFAQPDSDAIRTLDERGAYLNIRTGETWDLFFPGYYTSDQRSLEHQLGSRSVGHRFAGEWYFNPTAFNIMRHHVELESQGRWVYSGGTDLVLINLWLPERGDPVIDWESVQSGSLTESSDGTSTLTVAQVIETVSRDLESDAQDAAYGVARVTHPEKAESETVGTKIMIGALGGMLAAFGKNRLGL